MLFFNPKIKKWQIIAWDLDNSQGILKDQYDALMRSDIFNPAVVNKSLLFEKVFSSSYPRFRGTLQARLKGYLKTGGFSSPATFNAMIDQLEGTIRGNIEDWEGYNHLAFIDIKNFARARYDKTMPQL